MGARTNGNGTRTAWPAPADVSPPRFPVLAGAGTPVSASVTGADGYIDQELTNGDRFVIAVEHLPRYVAALIAAGLDATSPSSSAS